jgi:hypothetical protein
VQGRGHIHRGHAIQLGNGTGRLEPEEHVGVAERE